MITENARIETGDVHIPSTKLVLPTTESKNSMLSIAVTPWRNLRGVKIELECHSLFRWAHLKRSLSIRLNDDRWWHYKTNLVAVKYMIEAMQNRGCSTSEESEFWMPRISARLRAIGILI